MTSCSPAEPDPLCPVPHRHCPHRPPQGSHRGHQGEDVCAALGSAAGADAAAARCARPAQPLQLWLHENPGCRWSRGNGHELSTLQPSTGSQHTCGVSHMQTAELFRAAPEHSHTRTPLRSFDPGAYSPCRGTVTSLLSCPDSFPCIYPLPPKFRTARADDLARRGTLQPNSCGTPTAPLLQLWTQHTRRPCLTATCTTMTGSCPTTGVCVNTYGAVMAAHATRDRT